MDSFGVDFWSCSGCFRVHFRTIFGDGENDGDDDDDGDDDCNKDDDDDEDKDYDEDDASGHNRFGLTIQS